MLARYRFGRYLTGATLARTADELSAPAVLLLGLAALRSSSASGLVYGALTIAAAVGGPVLGALLDRAQHPGTFLAGCLAGYGVGLGTVGLCVGRLPLPAVVAVAFAAGLVAPALSGGWTSMLPSVVHSRDLHRAVALDAITYDAATLTGPAVAAAVAALAGPRWAVAAAVVLLVAAAGPALSLPGHVREQAAATSVRTELRAGLRAMWTIIGLRRITAASCTSYAGYGMLLVACPLLGRAHLGSAAHGTLLLTVLAAASLLTTVVIARWPLPVPPEAGFALTTTLSAIALLITGLTTSPVGIVVGVALFGISDGPRLPAILAVRHRDAPDALRAQIFTTAASVKIGAGAVGAMVAGRLASSSLPATLVVAAVLQIAATVLVRPDLRRGARTRSRTAAR